MELKINKMTMLPYITPKTLSDQFLLFSKKKELFILFRLQQICLQSLREYLQEYYTISATVTVHTQRWFRGTITIAPMGHMQR